jgi:hypothetical protein
VFVAVGFAIVCLPWRPIVSRYWDKPGNEPGEGAWGNQILKINSPSVEHSNALVVRLVQQLSVTTDDN